MDILLLIGIAAGLVMLWNFWRTIYKMGFVDSVLRRDFGLFTYDAFIAFFGLWSVYFMAAGWMGYSPVHDKALPPWETSFYSLLMFAIYAGMIYRHGKRLLQPTWAGSRESALRTLAVLEIINAAQLAHALQVCKEYEAAQLDGQPYHLDETRVIDVTPEVQK